MKRRPARTILCLLLGALLLGGALPPVPAFAANGVVSTPPPSPLGQSRTPASPIMKSAKNTEAGVVLSWKAVSGAKQYRVQRRTNTDGWVSLGKTTATTFTDASARSGVTYRYAVRAISSGGTQSARSQKPLTIRRIDPASSRTRSSSGRLTLSILGDSQSTWKNYSNGTAARTGNTAVKNNTTSYSGNRYQSISSVKNTWWMQTANTLKLDILVNDSWSGTTVATNRKGAGSAGYLRYGNLHDNTGSNAGQEPNLIAVFIGSNDTECGVTLGSVSGIQYERIDRNKKPTSMDFANAYAYMIRRMCMRYRNSEIYCFTIQDNKLSDYYRSRRIEANKIIRAVAAHYGLTIVDVFNDSGITPGGNTLISPYNTHFNTRGMTCIRKLFVKILRSSSVFL